VEVLTAVARVDLPRLNLEKVVRGTAIHEAIFELAAEGRVELLESEWLGGWLLLLADLCSDGKTGSGSARL
jgi:hypothetical protein